MRSRGSILDLIQGVCMLDHVPATEPTSSRIQVPQELRVSAGSHANVRLVSVNIETRCNYWISLYNQGSLAPADLIQGLQLEEIFDRACTEGANSQSPFVAVNTQSSGQPTYFYFSPPPRPENEDFWLAETCQKAHSFRPQIIGIYLSPQVMNAERASSLLISLLKRFIEEKATSEFDLFIGRHGLNSILNSALEIKALMRAVGYEISVFH